MRRLVDAEAGHTIYLGIEPRMVVSEEADLRADPSNQVIEPLGFARPTGSSTMPLEDHSGGSVVDEEHVCPIARDQGIDLIPGVVALPVCLQITRAAPVVGWPEAATKASDGERLVPLDDVEPLSVAQIEEPGQHLGIGPVVQPDEVLVVALDEQSSSRRGPSLGPPGREIPGAVVAFGRTVDAGRGRPDAEVADMEHPRKAHAERLLEGEDLLVEPVDGPVDIAGSANDHGSPCLPRWAASSRCQQHAQRLGIYWRRAISILETVATHDCLAFLAPQRRCGHRGPPFPPGRGGALCKNWYRRTIKTLESQSSYPPRGSCHRVRR